MDMSSEEQVFGHLQACDQDFMPPLSDRLDLRSYSKKILNLAHRCEAWSARRELIGLVAFYNNGAAGTAFITNVSVLSKYSGMGIGKRLVMKTIDYLMSQDAAELELEVNGKNQIAINLYRSLGFAEKGMNGTELKMVLNLKK